MRRICFLVPNLKTAGTVTDELLLARIEAMVKTHHPDADIEGTEPHIPAFP